VQRDSRVDDLRNPFQRDCDRITYSYPFRRLQDKTQVIPLPVIDFVHTRLTHSLEVATVGRSLGTLVESHLLSKGILEEGARGNIPSIVSAAGLAHDIGNPPFGHSGEDSISEYFKFYDGSTYLNNEYRKLNGDGRYIIRDIISECKIRDLQSFEGNAMGFRLLTRYDDTGLNLTCASLASFIKYPRQSFLEGEEMAGVRWNTERVSQKKYGFFQSEVSDIKIIAKEVGLKELFDPKSGNLSWARHPLAFLMEAADDICYRIIDLEDGFRIGRIPFGEAEEILLTIASKYQGFNMEYYNSISERGRNKKFSYLRSISINILILKCFEIFKIKYEELIAGEFDKDLIRAIDDQEIILGLDSIKEIVKKYIYNWGEVLSLEAAGFEILGGLLSEYTEASNICLTCPPDIRSKRSSKIFDLLPGEHRHLDHEESYDRYLKIACYISGMTDSFAINLFQRIKGINANRKY
jgi:dGTPase